MLAPRLLDARAGNVEGSREMLALTPAALYVQLVVATCNPDLPPPWHPRSTARATRWAWLLFGAMQWFSGQTALARPAIARRLREDSRPDFPPGLKDAALLGGSVVDLVAREQGTRAAVELACGRLPGGGAARGAADGLRRPRDRAHRGHVARAPVAHGGAVGRRSDLAESTDRVCGCC